MILFPYGSIFTIFNHENTSAIFRYKFPVLGIQLFHCNCFKMLRTSVDGMRPSIDACDSCSRVPMRSRSSRRQPGAFPTRTTGDDLAGGVAGLSARGTLLQKSVGL